MKVCPAYHYTQHFHELWLLKPLQSDKYMGHISLFLVVKMKDKFPSRRLFYPKLLQWRNIKCLTEERRKNCQKKQFGYLYSFIHFFVLCLKSIPFLYFWELTAVQDHVRSILGIICSLRIICGWGSFTILYRSLVTNDVISSNYSNYCIQCLP